MAAELFTNFADIKLYVGGRLNQSVKLESLEATIYETARRHIVPWLTQTLYDRLVAGSSLTAEETALALKVKRSLALLTIYEYSKVGVVEFGESGMHRVENENRKSAYRYQEREFKEDALIKGYNALEDAIKYLDANAAFTTWAASDEGLAHRSTLLNYASDFRLLTMPECDRYTYECIRPIINEVELFGIQRILPATFWAGFKSRHLAGSLTTAEKQVRTYMRQAIAHRAINEAVKQRWIKIDAGRVAIQEDFGDQRNTNQTMPSTVGSGLYISHDTWSDRFTSQWIDYIKANPTLFVTAFDADSGGTNTDADAWHINTDDEQVVADDATVEVKKRPIFRM
jgi:hypothetical protein